MTFLQAHIAPGFVTTAGVIGFVDLLVAGSFIPEEATLLRTSAFVWFFAFGIVRIALGHFLARRARATAEQPARRSTEPRSR